MAKETLNGHHTVAAAGSSPHTAERLAGGTAERRTEQHPIEVAVFGGSRSSDKRDGKVHGVGVARKFVWFAVIVLALAAWPVYMGWVIEPGSGAGYYLGLVGGVMMLLMLLYPVRKHAAWARNWGPLRYWFMLHMLFGIAGPTMVLFHSTFHVKSLNAGVALYSMLLVAFSGIIGRFIYQRIHHGLYGRKSNLEELQQAVDTKQEKVNMVVMEVPEISERLKHFRDIVVTQKSSFLIRVWRFMTSGWRRRRLEKFSRRELQRAVVDLAKTHGWDKDQQSRHFQEALMQVKDYLEAVLEAAQFTAYERLFRLWHILHTPFVWLLGISGIVHVIAVNMY